MKTYMKKLSQYFLELFKNGCPYANECEVHEEECDQLPVVSEIGHDVDCMWLEVFDIITEEEKGGN
jgi:hypothetical protein